MCIYYLSTSSLLGPRPFPFYPWFNLLMPHIHCDGCTCIFRSLTMVATTMTCDSHVIHYILYALLKLYGLHAHACILPVLTSSSDVWLEGSRTTSPKFYKLFRIRQVLVVEKSLKAPRIKKSGNPRGIPRSDQEFRGLSITTFGFLPECLSVCLSLSLSLSPPLCILDCVGGSPLDARLPRKENF
jgi:hypothetical protein